MLAQPLLDEVRRQLAGGGLEVMHREEIRSALQTWPQPFSVAALIADPAQTLDLAYTLGAAYVIIIELESATTVSGEHWQADSGHALQLNGRRILAETKPTGGVDSRLSFGVTADDPRTVISETAHVITAPLFPRPEPLRPQVEPVAAPPRPSEPEPPTPATVRPAEIPDILPPPEDDPLPDLDISGPSELFPGAPGAVRPDADTAADRDAHSALAEYMATPPQRTRAPQIPGPRPPPPTRPQPVPAPAIDPDSPRDQINQLVQDWESQRIVSGRQIASLDRIDRHALNPAERLEVKTVITGVRNAVAIADRDKREQHLRAVLDRPIPPQAVKPAWIPFWQARAIAAIKLHDVRDGWMAGQQLLALDALQSEDEAIIAVLVGLNLNNWLIPDPPMAPAPGQDYSVDLGGGAVMDFVWIPALRAWVGKYEVTNAQFRRFRPAHNSGTLDIPNRHGVRPNLNNPSQPVVQVSYHDAVEFTEWLVRQPGIRGTGVTPRLLDGDEWTAIARCGTSRKYPWGNEWPPDRGNYADAATGREFPNWNVLPDYDDGFAVAAAVEYAGGNEWGLYGVGGNVWEWTREHSGWGRTLRGASWDYAMEEVLRIDFHGSFAEDSRNFALGFRVILVPND